MSKIIIANWKNHPETFEQARELLEFSASEAVKYPDVKIVICPPEKFLRFLLPVTSFLGTQDVFWRKPEEAPQGVSYALVGHSDRRNPSAGGGDTEEIINQKLKLALSAGVTPILLVGEKEKGEDRQKILEIQLSGALANLLTSDVEKVMIAYEPVWAISRPDADVDVFKFSQSPKLPAYPIVTILNPDTPENTLEAIKIIQEFLSTSYQLPVTNYQFLYGGSITDKNVADFLRHPEIAGAVIGGASLRKKEFANILKIVSEI